MIDTEEHAVYEAADMAKYTCGVSSIYLPPEKPSFKSLGVTDAEVILTGWKLMVIHFSLT